MQVVLVHRGGVTELGVLILKLLSIAYLARTRHRPLGKRFGCRMITGERGGNDGWRGGQT